MTAALYEAQIRHVRVDPVRNAFRYRSYYWLVDIDHLPRLPWPLRALAGFDPRDHFDDPSEPIRANLDRLLAEHGIDVSGGLVLMLAHAKVLGYVFNPLSLFWCHDGSGSLAAIVAEVHNTYGDRHSYVLPPSEDGVSRVDKRFYVSPFYDVSGSYRMRLPVPDDRLAVTIALHHDEPGARPFIATLRGTRRPATTGGLIRAALRHPWSTLVGAALIRFQGIRLHLKGLPVMPRPTAARSRRTTARSASEAARSARPREIKETVS
ncbi:MAG TPA: DUF1365 domain-containing protein [Micromonosporaceae bacterium]